MLHRAPGTSRPGPGRVPSESLAQEFGSPAQRTTALFLRSRAAQSISIPTLEELKMNLKLISAAVTATMVAVTAALMSFRFIFSSSRVGMEMDCAARERKNNAVVRCAGEPNSCAKLSLGTRPGPGLDVPGARCSISGGGFPFVIQLSGVGEDNYGHEETREEGSSCEAS